MEPNPLLAALGAIAVAIATGLLANRGKQAEATVTGNADLAKAQLASGDTQAARLWERIESLEARQQVVEDKNNALTIENATLKARQELLSGQLAVAQDQIAALGRQLAAVTTERDTLRQLVDGLKTRIADLERRLMEYEPEHKQEPTP